MGARTKRVPSCIQLLCTFLTGPYYNIDRELNSMMESVENSEHNKVDIRDIVKAPNLKPFLICLLLLVFVQLSGAIEILFYMDSIIQVQYQTERVIHEKPI